MRILSEDHHDMQDASWSFFNWYHIPPDVICIVERGSWLVS